MCTSVENLARTSETNDAAKRALVLEACHKAARHKMRFQVFNVDRHRLAQHEVTPKRPGNHERERTQRAINVNLAKFVLNHRHSPVGGLVQEVIEQRRLSGPKKACDYCHGRDGVLTPVRHLWLTAACSGRWRWGRALKLLPT